MVLLVVLTILVGAVTIVCGVKMSGDNSHSKCSKIRQQLLKPNGNRFVAIDFETANDKYYSACSLGIVVFERQQPVERKTFLINPTTKFDPINISIHGITDDIVKDAPTFDKVWPIVCPYLTKYKIVMYSDFDAKVLKSLTKKYDLKPIGASSIRLDCFDACQALRDTVVGLTNYKLSTVCQYLGIEGLNHHEATSDAEACGKIYCWLYNHRGKVTNVTNDRPATYAQQDYIRNLGGVVPPILSVREASMLIDKLIQEKENRREAEYRARQADREAKRVAEKEAKKAEKLYKMRKKEEDALRFLADEMADSNYKARKSRSKRVQDLREFQVLVNKVLADGVIEGDEVLQIKAWLSDHMVLNDDFSKMFNLIDEVFADGKIDEVEAQSLYEGLLDCMTTLRNRQL